MVLLPVVEKPLIVVGPGNAAELDMFQQVFMWGSSATCSNGEHLHDRQQESSQPIMMVKISTAAVNSQQAGRSTSCEGMNSI